MGERLRNHNENVTRKAKKTQLFLFAAICSIGFIFSLASYSQERKTNEKQLTFGDGPDQFPSWSPAGTTIAFHSQRGGNIDIWTVPTAGGLPTRLTKTQADENFPRWSPDGKYIAFVRFTHGANKGWGNLFMMNADGTNERQLTDDGTAKLGFAWLPDGKSLIYSRWFAHFSPNLLKSLDGGFKKLVFSSLEFIEYKGPIEMTEPRVTVRQELTKSSWKPIYGFWTSTPSLNGSSLRVTEGERGRESGSGA